MDEIQGRKRGDIRPIFLPNIMAIIILDHLVFKSELVGWEKYNEHRQGHFCKVYVIFRQICWNQDLEELNPFLMITPSQYLTILYFIT